MNIWKGVAPRACSCGCDDGFLKKSLKMGEIQACFIVMF